MALLTATRMLGLDDSHVYNAARQLFTQGQARAEQLGVDKSFVYLNYAAQFQDPIASYGAASVQKLRVVSAQYDPDGMFSRWLPGGFKIPTPWLVHIIQRK